MHISMDYCLSHKVLPLRDVEFWCHGDFFATSPKEAQPLVDTLLAFIRRYGLPACTLALMLLNFYLQF